ncbi:MAG: hypothetical protein LBJ62_05280 [Bifidobacteriaceae bacterium]|jgi:hypothetical protein|nr:hypothetical protein [Bifidobacteriaceae bacterium]
MDWDEALDVNERVVMFAVPLIDPDSLSDPMDPLQAGEYQLAMYMAIYWLNQAGKVLPPDLLAEARRSLENQGNEHEAREIAAWLDVMEAQVAATS